MERLLTNSSQICIVLVQIWAALPGVSGDEGDVCDLVTTKLCMFAEFMRLRKRTPRQRDQICELLTLGYPAKPGNEPLVRFSELKKSPGRDCAMVSDIPPGHQGCTKTHAECIGETHGFLPCEASGHCPPSGVLGYPPGYNPLISGWLPMEAGVESVCTAGQVCQSYMRPAKRVILPQWKTISRTFLPKATPKKRRDSTMLYQKKPRTI